MQALGVTTGEIDIRPSATQMLREIRHPAVVADPMYDITYENVQAGERTSHLFRLANHHGGLVVGTGDLSELALGWCRTASATRCPITASTPRCPRR
jgi:NAD+ synthase (glutamine-hydrolysing)